MVVGSWARFSGSSRVSFLFYSWIFVGLSFERRVPFHQHPCPCTAISTLTLNSKLDFARVSYGEYFKAQSALVPPQIQIPLFCLDVQRILMGLRV